jgi:hypothetical protein
MYLRYPVEVEREKPRIKKKKKRGKKKKKKGKTACVSPGWCRTSDRFLN